jgi:hypothetical protein
MSFILNEYDVDDAVRYFDTIDGDFPNYNKAAQAMSALVDWTNRNSDGWPYWSKPAAASKRLQEALSTAMLARYSHPYRPERDLTSKELKSLLTPVKAFLTRHGAVLSLGVT